MKAFSKSWGMLALAVALGAVAFWLANSYLATQEAELRERLLGDQADVRQVVVAVRHLQPGDVASAETMAVASVPVHHLSSTAVSPQDFEYFNGQVLSKPMSPGEPLLAHFVSGMGIVRFSDLLEAGERAVTLEVDELNSNAGMLTAGDFVDVFVLLEPDDLEQSSAAEGKGDGQFLLPVQQRVRILSIGRNPLLSREQDFVVPVSEDGYEQSYATVTVGVRQEDAARLRLAQDLGEIVFMLRNAEDARAGVDVPLDRRLLLQDLLLSRQPVIEYYAGGSGAGGVVQPTLISTESIAGDNGRRAVKSVPVDGFLADAAE